MKITVGICTNDNMKNDTVLSLLGLIGATKHSLHIILQPGCYVHESREKIVKAAIEAKSDYLFFMDADMKLPGNTIDRLLQHDKDVIGCNYHCRQHPLESTVKIADKDWNIYPSQIPTQLFECFGVGTGSMLVKMSVFVQIDKPWFSFDIDKNGGIMGEDIFFCRQVKRAGMSVWCDPTISVKHIGNYEY